MKSKKPIVMPEYESKEYQKFLREVVRLVKNSRKLKKSFIRVGSSKTDTGIN